MSRRNLILVIAGGAMLIVVILFILSSLMQRGGNEKLVLITPAPSRSLSVVASSIQDRQINVPLTSEIVITFNQEVNSSLISFNILPTPNYVFEIEQNRLIITPTEQLLPSTIYSFSVSSTKDNSLLTSVSFTTFGPTPTLLPDTRPSGEPQNTEALLLQTRPDVFLSNKMPYENESFSATYTFVSQTPSHFAFTIDPKGTTENARSSFINWAKSLGLSDAQISSLDISYN